MTQVTHKGIIYRPLLINDLNVVSEEFAAIDGYIDQVLVNPACGKPECWELGNRVECIEGR